MGCLHYGNPLCGKQYLLDKGGGLSVAIKFMNEPITASTIARLGLTPNAKICGASGLCLTKANWTENARTRYITVDSLSDTEEGR